ncbi:hypothetical protein [Protaetiibacter mangrovi]|uniref:DUF2975 domain-containing protein n=1 Tax=Protaetiibacter mangrovi TaxID=2970926 RepID=A0ABT1ZCQ7_9MICO|nr:hypothetical protein [Protaetiibacter mangrovi]MCS0498498.1 hypothetical protein [Protaetiibacter mangrovi]TPW94067.1 hypothetical protein FJ656_34700 [Schumannella luteola]
MLQQVALVLTVVTVVTCLAYLARSVFAGRVFGPGNSRLVGTAGIVGLVGFAVVPFFGNMGANAAFAQISDGTFDNVVMAIQPFPFILAAFAVALITTVFVVGERLQRDAEGLV